MGLFMHYSHYSRTIEHFRLSANILTKFPVFFMLSVKLLHESVARIQLKASPAQAGKSAWIRALADTRRRKWLAESR
jgi:hypothetical protein